MGASSPSALGVSDQGGPCAPPAGPYPNGTIEIRSSDTGSLTFKIYQSPSYDIAPFVHDGLSFDGLYSASICP